MREMVMGVCADMGVKLYARFRCCDAVHSSGPKIVLDFGKMVHGRPDVGVNREHKPW